MFLAIDWAQKFQNYKVQYLSVALNSRLFHYILDPCSLFWIFSPPFFKTFLSPCETNKNPREMSHFVAKKFFRHPLKHTSQKPNPSSKYYDYENPKWKNVFCFIWGLHLELRMRPVLTGPNKCLAVTTGNIFYLNQRIAFLWKKYFPLHAFISVTKYLHFSLALAHSW